jgi:transcriptional regulator with XRE-family HTH domain
MSEGKAEMTTAQADRDLIAANIRAYRARRGMSQDEVTEKMRAQGYRTWSANTVGRVERGRRECLAPEILGLARALGTFPVHLISEPELPTGIPAPAR